jgi:hypothetical protein
VQPASASAATVTIAAARQQKNICDAVCMFFRLECLPVNAFPAEDMAGHK